MFVKHLVLGRTSFKRCQTLFFLFSIVCVWSAVCLADPVRGCRAGLRVGGLGGKRRHRSIHVVAAVEGRAMSGGWKGKNGREKEKGFSIQGATGTLFLPGSESHEWSNRIDGPKRV